MSSAIELQEVGWPDLLSLVILTLWILSLVAMSRSAWTWSWDGPWYKSSEDILSPEEV